MTLKDPATCDHRVVSRVMATLDEVHATCIQCDLRWVEAWEAPPPASSPPPPEAPAPMASDGGIHRNVARDRVEDTVQARCLDCGKEWTEDPSEQVTPTAPASQAEPFYPVAPQHPDDDSTPTTPTP